MMRLLTLAGLAVRLANVPGMIRSAALRAFLAAIGLLFVVAAAGFGLFAVYLALVPPLGSIGSACAIGGALLVVGLILLLIAGRIARRPPVRLEDQIAAELKQRYEHATEALGGTPLTNPIVLLAGAALLVGYLMGRRPKRRD